jgi:V/A-type H+-transporting ATPase subunit E
VFDLAARQISNLSGAPHEKALGGLIREGLGVIGSKARIECASKDRKAVAAAIRRLGGKAKISLSEEPIATIGGIILTSPDGSVRFDNTFEARLERMRPDLRKGVAEILTGSV